MSILHDALSATDFNITEVVCGMARGADKLGYDWAVSNKIPVKEFKPNWEKHGKRAGFLRNIEMADYADGLIALWDLKSKGTEHMISAMVDRGKGVEIQIIKEKDEGTKC